LKSVSSKQVSTGLTTWSTRFEQFGLHGSANLIEQLNSDTFNPIRGRLEMQKKKPNDMFGFFNSRLEDYAVGALLPRPPRRRRRLRGAVAPSADGAALSFRGAATALGCDWATRGVVTRG
jgi:hypothetical protein